MTLPEINEVQNIRKKMDLSLREFAKKCDLTVSWINQVEIGLGDGKTGIKDPSYLKMKKIFDMYEMEKNEKQKTAGELCVTEMIKFNLGSLIEDANKIMIKNGISQIPVFKKNNCVGMITDKVIMDLIDSDVSKIKITPEMLELPPPTVNSETPLRALRRILNYFEYVLVEKNGKSYGILVRQDLMKLLGTKK
jgi:predicted transcriptional regulator